jgi:hypothetical protein
MVLPKYHQNFISTKNKKRDYRLHTTIVVTINVVLNNPPRAVGVIEKFAPCSRVHVPTWKKVHEIILILHSACFLL